MILTPICLQPSPKYDTTWCSFETPHNTNQGPPTLEEGGEASHLIFDFELRWQLASLILSRPWRPAAKQFDLKGSATPGLLWLLVVRGSFRPREDDADTSLDLLSDNDGYGGGLQKKMCMLINGVVSVCCTLRIYYDFYRFWLLLLLRGDDDLGVIMAGSRSKIKSHHLKRRQLAPLVIESRLEAVKNDKIPSLISWLDRGCTKLQ